MALVVFVFNAHFEPFHKGSTVPLYPDTVGAFFDACYLSILPPSNNPNSIKTAFYHNPFTPWTSKHRTWENLYPEKFSGRRKHEISSNAVQDQKAKLCFVARMHPQRSTTFEAWHTI